MVEYNGATTRDYSRDSPYNSRTAMNRAFTSKKDFDGVKLVTYGHSYTVANGSFVTQGKEYFSLLKDRYGFSSAPSYGVAGMLSPEVFRAMNVGYSVGSTGIRPIGAKDVVMLHCTFNDTTRSGTTDTTKCVNRFKHSMRSSLACLTAGTKITAYGSSNVTRVGTFSLAGQGASREWLGYAMTSTIGDYIEYTITGDVAHILGFSWDTSQTNNAPIVEVKVDGVVKTTLNYGNDTVVKYARITDGLDTVNSPRTDTISGMGAGTHVIRLTLMAGSVGQWHSEAIYTPSTLPSPIAVMLDPIPGPLASMYAYHVANRSLFKDALNTVLADFPSAVLVDLFELSSNLPYFTNDYIHPNDPGADWIHDIIAIKMIDNITRPVATLI